MTESDELYREFMTADVDEQLRMIRDPSKAQTLRSRLGDQAFAEYAKLAAAGSGPVLSGQTTNMIVVPGIMGSLLVSSGLGGMWWIDAPRELNRLDGLALTPDGTGDRIDDAKLSPAGLDAVYIAFRSALRDRDDLAQIGHPYDWRKPITLAAEGLAATIDQLFADNGETRIHLATHSMGGLVARAALRQRPDLWDKIGKIAFMATPHYGSPAIAGYLKHHFWGLNLFHLLGRYLSRETFRSMWGALSLLPAPSGVYPGTRAADGDSAEPTDHPCANFDLYDAGAYRLELSDDQRVQLQAVLDHAAGFHRDLEAWHRGLSQVQRNTMLVIAGVGQRTLFRMAYKAPVFGFDWDRMDRVTSRKEGNRHREGDGRVPLASSELESVGATRYVKAEHAKVPSVPAVWNDVFAWFTDHPLELPTTPGAALAAHLGGDESSVTPTLAGPTGLPTTPDDPGYLEDRDPSEGELAELDDRLRSGALPDFERLRML